jgi:hypothetical protein
MGKKDLTSKNGTPKSRATKPALEAKANGSKRPAVLLPEPVITAPPSAETQHAGTNGDAALVSQPATRPKAPARRKLGAPRVVAPAFTDSDVALRAYFLSERRRIHGLPGDEHQDWIEAERQLQSESAPKPKAKGA